MSACLSDRAICDVIVCVTVCREFVNICHAALDLNAQLIGVDQLVYHKSLKDNFRQIVLRLAEMFGETVSASDRAAIG